MPEFSLSCLANYFLGGSPCSGKSSVADALAARHGFQVYCCDDSLFKHMSAADPATQPAMAKAARLDWNGLFMRPVEEQVADEIAFYHEELPLLLDEIAALPPDRPILAEGNAWLPELLVPLGVVPQRLLYLIPTPAFQQAHYARRGFIQDILAQCSDPAVAFHNWMERDARFGAVVRSQAEILGLCVIQVDGSLTLDETVALVENAFNLG